MNDSGRARAGIDPDAPPRETAWARAGATFPERRLTSIPSDVQATIAARRPRRRACAPAGRPARRFVAALMVAVLGLVSTSPVALLCWHTLVPAESGAPPAGEHAHHAMPDSAPADESPAPDHGMPNDCLRHCASAPVVALPTVSAAVVAVAPIAVPARVATYAERPPVTAPRLLPFANGPPAAGLART